jgi:hypothetical protein
MDEKVIRRAAPITLRRAILERFPPVVNAPRGCGGCRVRQGTEAPAELIDVRRRGGVLSR